MHGYTAYFLPFLQRQLKDEGLPKWGLLLKTQISSSVKAIPLRREAENETGRIPAPKSVTIHLK